MTVNNSISDLLAAPLSSDWTVESLAEQVLDAIAVRPMSEAQEFVLDRTDTTDRQSQRILRPLIACLAAKSAKESGMSPKLYGGRLSFKRPGPNGPVWIVGEFNNRPDAVCVALRRSASKPKNLEDKPGQTRSTGIPHYVPTDVDTWIALGSSELHPDYAARFSEMSTVACLVEPTEPHSIYFECKLEEQRHKWIESEKAGYDLGDLAIRQWALCHWQGFVRARWLEHLEGKRFWVEIGPKEFGRLKREFKDDDKLLERILDLLRAGAENLGVLQWAQESSIPAARVIEILEAINLNECRLSHRFDPDL